MANAAIATLERDDSSPATAPARTEPRAPTAALPFTICYVLPGRDLVEGEVFDINLNGGVLMFPRDHCPHFTFHADAVLQLRVNATGKTLPIHARQLDSDTSAGTRQCWFEFKDPTGLFERLDEELRPYFNRRRSFRVEPPESLRIAVALEWKGGATTGVLGNISASGIAIEVGDGAASKIAEVKELWIKSSLPGMEAPICMAGNVCSLHPTRIGMRCGIIFNSDATPNFKENEALILKYVIRRQLELLKARAGEKA